MTRLLCCFCCLLGGVLLEAQTPATLDHIRIARDSFGVPHIYAPTDREVAYGLAWVQCEDDFKTVQEQLMAIKGYLGEHWGKRGVLVDFGIKFMGLREEVESRYDSEVSAAFKTYLQRFADGINNYAALHEEEVLLKKVFPIHPKDLLVGYLLGLAELTGARKHLESIINESVLPYEATQTPKGSNAFAFSKRITKDDKTYLAINSHQPLEGWYSWYEAHLMSDEGMNILGGTFPLGVSILHGTNAHLGWAHTVNHPDLTDVYQLEMHPDKKGYYRFDGEWRQLEERKYRAKVKVLGFIKLPIKRTIYKSVYGPTFKTKKGYFAIRAVASLGIKAAEQWYRMTKATHFEEWYECLKMQGHPGMNIVYADKEDHIFYLSNGRFPVRDPQFDWQQTLPGNTSASLWEEYYPLDSVLQVLDPSCGYVFNTNNSPFVATAEGENVLPSQIPSTMGYKPKALDNNRSIRFKELMQEHAPMYDYETFKAIKFDIQYPQRLVHHQITNLELLMELDASAHPDLADAIALLQGWDRRADLDSEAMPLFALTVMQLNEKLVQEYRLKDGGSMTEADAVFALGKAKKLLLEEFGRLAIPLREYQMLSRGEVRLPIAGGPDLLRAVYCILEEEEGYCKNIAGDSYLQLVRYGANGVEIESVHSYGASAKPGDAHYTDQMELFVQDGLKRMTLDREEVFERAVRVYSPGGE
ncbi:MAG: penicillin acylase family protein [Bacteroidota bacterium]